MGVPIWAGLVCATLCVPLGAYPQNAYPHNLGAVFEAYTEERMQAGETRGEGWHEHWIERFSNALAMDGDSAPAASRLRVLQEMAALQQGAGALDDARATFERMGEEAAEAGELDLVIAALFQHTMSLDPASEFDAFAENSDRLWEWHAWQLDGGGLEAHFALQRYQTNLHAIGQRHLLAAHQQDGDPALRAAMHARARAALGEAHRLALEAGDARGIAHIGLSLAEVETLVGNAGRASEIYRALLANKGLPLPRTRVEVAHLELRTRAAAGSTAYLAGLRGILDTYPPDGGYLSLQSHFAAQLMEVGRHGEALETIYGLLDSDLGDDMRANAMGLAVACHAQLGEFGKADEMLEELIARFPRSRAAADALEARGRELRIASVLPGDVLAKEDPVEAPETGPTPSPPARAAGSTETAGPIPAAPLPDANARAEGPGGDWYAWAIAGAVGGALFAAMLALRSLVTR